RSASARAPPPWFFQEVSTEFRSNRARLLQQTVRACRRRSGTRRASPAAPRASAPAPRSRPDRGRAARRAPARETRPRRGPRPARRAGGRAGSPGSPRSSPAGSSREPRVGEREALDRVAHQRPREVELRAVAQALERLGLELGHDHVGGGLDGRLARLLAATDERHLAEAFAFVDHAEETPFLRDLDLAPGEEIEARARRIFAQED